MHVDMKLVGGRGEDAEGRGRWRDSICCGGSRRSKSRRSREHVQKDEAGYSRAVLCCTFTVLSTAPEKRRPLETARAVTLP